MGTSPSSQRARSERQSFEGEQESWGAENAIAPRLAAARIAWLAENLMQSCTEAASPQKKDGGAVLFCLSNLKAEGLYLRFKFRGAVLHLNLRGAVLTAVGIGTTLGREATDALLLG